MKIRKAFTKYNEKADATQACAVYDIVWEKKVEWCLIKFENSMVNSSRMEEE